MNWLIISLGSVALLAGINFIDKYILSKQIKDYRGLSMYTAILGFIAGTIFWFFSGFQLLSFRDAGIVLLTGVLAIWSMPIYFKALSKEETSLIIILFQAIPVFILILSFLFLRETISLKQLIAFCIIMSVSIVASLENEKLKFKISSNLIYILIYDLMWAISAILIKFATNLNSFSKIISYEGWGIGIGGLLLYLLFPQIRKSFLRSTRRLKRKTMYTLIFNESLYVIAKSLVYFAYSIGPVALVSVIGSAQVFFGILYGWILTLWLPKIFKEKITPQAMLKKSMLACLLIVGVWLIY